MSQLVNLMTVAEMAEKSFITLNTIEARTIGMAMACAAKTHPDGEKTLRVERKYQDAKGHHQKTKVNAYPFSMYSNFIHACAAMGKL